MTGLGREYGEAIYSLATDENLRVELRKQLTEIARLLKETPQFLQLLCSRAVERTTRLQIVEETFAGRVHPYVLNFIKLMVEKERFGAFPDCVAWFQSRYNEDFNIVQATVTSALPLTKSQIDALRGRLCVISGKTVELELQIDPAVIGGLRVEMDGRRYDNTIQNRLDRMRYNLVTNL